MARRYELRDRVVFITGAGSGIGRACAAAFHAAGARIVAVGRRADRLEALWEQLGAERVAVAAADVTVAGQREAALSVARQHFGGIDVLVNNAGWAGYGPAASLPEEHVERMLALNVAAPAALVRAVLPEMIARGSGQIVNVSSVVAFQPMPRMAMYSATKAALSAFSTALRLELRETGVDVVLIEPGSTRTEFFESAAQVNTRAVRYSRLQQSPEHVAGVIVRACRNRRREVVLSVEGRLIALLRRFSRRLADAVAGAAAARTMKEGGG